MLIRPATIDDAEAINEIYNFYVRNSTCTFDLEDQPLDRRLDWMNNRDPKHSVIVAEIDGIVVGWGSLNPFKDRPAYRFTSETSVYIHPDYHRKGIGRTIVVRLIDLGREHGFRSLIAGVTADQEASIQLHLNLGFVQTAHFKEVGFKFDRWLDTKYFQLTLDK